jgi:hypothetical protein
LPNFFKPSDWPTSSTDHFGQTWLNKPHHFGQIQNLLIHNHVLVVFNSIKALKFNYYFELLLVILL